MSDWPFSSKELAPARWDSLSLADRMLLETAALVTLEELPAIHEAHCALHEAKDKADARVREIGRKRAPLLRLVDPPDEREAEQTQ